MSEEDEYGSDVDFQPCGTSLGSKSQNFKVELEEIKWCRPKNFCVSSNLFGESLTFPIQGKLDNCWLITACYAVAKLGLLNSIFEIIPDFFSNKISILKIKYFSPFDGWSVIKIDEYLPIRNNKLIFASCQNSDVLWASYIEKAFAKKFKSYEHLSRGETSEAFIALTGGFCLKMNHKKMDANKKSVLKTLSKLLRNDKCVTTISFNESKNIENVIDDHYYILEITDYSVKNDEEFKIKMINCSEASVNKEIEILSSQLMDCDFNLIFLLQNLNVFSPQKSQLSSWTTHLMSSSWEPLLSSGGNLNCSSYHLNPQFLLTILENHPKTCIHISLFQTNHRESLKRKSLHQAIGIHVWEVKSEINQNVSWESLKRNKSIKCTKPEYNYTNDVTLLLYTTSCRLVVIPSTFVSNISTEFSLQISTSQFSTVKQLKVR